jgi:type III secretion protein R
LNPTRSRDIAAMDLTQFSPSSALLTVIVLALVPFVAVMVTSFTKLVVVLSLLRNALGLQQVPPNVVLNGLALVLSIYVMYPVGAEMNAKAQGIDQIASSTKNMLAAADAAKEPLRAFLLRHSRPLERAFFLKTARQALKPEQAAQLDERDFLVVVPAFTVSELSVAFEIGFLIFLPFLVIDLVISNVLMAMGMMMLSPTTVSMPFKLLLFVLIDGWVKLVHGLVLTYA